GRAFRRADCDPPRLKAIVRNRFAVPLKRCPDTNPSLRLLLRDPLVGAGFEQIEGQRAAVEHFVGKLAEIELRPHFFLGAFTQLPELELAELITERLRRP